MSVLSPERFDLRAIAPQPWKNGAGITREIAFGGPSSADFDWRISVAEVERDAPFSAFAGVDRCIVLLRGAGMRLNSADGGVDHMLTTPLAPFRFSGDVALAATLVDGACSDFNVMTRRGVWRSDVSILRSEAQLQRAGMTMVLCVDGQWEVDGVTLAPMQGVLLPLPRGEGASPRAHPDGEGANGVLLVVRLDRETSS